MKLTGVDHFYLKHGNQQSQSLTQKIYVQGGYGHLPVSRIRGMDRKGSFGGITFCYRQSLSKYLIVFDDFCENVFWAKDHSFSIWVFCHEHSRTTGLQGKGGGGPFLNSSLPLPPTSQPLRHQPRYYCRQLTSAHSQQPDSNREPSERKSLTTKLRALRQLSWFFMK